MKPPTVLGSTILALSLLALGPAVAQQAPPAPPAPPGQVDQQPPDQPPDQPDEQPPSDQPNQQAAPDQQPPDEAQDQGKMQPAQPETQPAQPSQAPRGKKTSCTMKFDLKGWSVVYKSASGSGKITCDNGQKADVKLSAKGGGLTAGKYVVKGGRGKFSAVRDIKDLFGRYATAGTTVQTGTPVQADLQVVSKGKVTLGLAGASVGVNLGVSVGELTIRQANG
jgi:hypothetical protein